VIAELRAELATLAGGLGVTIEPVVPEEVQPPCVVLQPADPFVVDDDPDATFAEPYAIRFELLILVQLDTETSNAAATAELDGLLGQLLDQLAGSAWSLVSMGAPGPMLTTDWISHGQRVTVKRNTHL